MNFPQTCMFILLVHHPCTPNICVKFLVRQQLNKSTTLQHNIFISKKYIKFEHSGADLSRIRSHANEEMDQVSNLVKLYINVVLAVCRTSEQKTFITEFCTNQLETPYIIEKFSKWLISDMEQTISGSFSTIKY